MSRVARPPRHPLLKSWAIVAAGLLVVVIMAGVFVWREVRSAEDHIATCRVTEAGEAWRHATEVTEDEGIGLREGDTYRSDSGCMPVDEFAK